MCRVALWNRIREAIAVFYWLLRDCVGNYATIAALKTIQYCNPTQHRTSLTANPQVAYGINGNFLRDQAIVADFNNVDTNASVGF